MPSTQIDCKITLGGADIKPEEVHDILVEADLDQPDHAILTLSNASTHYSEQINEGDDLEIDLGFMGEGAKKPGAVFKGEIVGLEPVFDVRGPARVHVRGLNQLHRLMRGKKSMTFQKVTDKDIVGKLCQSYGLTAEYSSPPPSTKYEHVYQANLTDLEFIRMRAARIGFEVFVEDKKLYFRKRIESDSGIVLGFGVSGDGTLERFTPRLSTVQQVSEVKVYGWDPDKKQQIIGNAKPQSSKLGDKSGATVASSKHSGVLQVTHDSPVASQEEADNIAKSILNDRMMSFITGDAVCHGNADLKPGIVVTIDVPDKRFKGKYHIVSTRHRYVHAGPGGGYRTELKVRRDAESTG
jgi:phage protein D